MSAEEAAERGGKLLPAPALVARGDKMLSFVIEKWGFKEPVSCCKCARLTQFYARSTLCLALIGCSVTASCGTSASLRLLSSRMQEAAYMP